MPESPSGSVAAAPAPVAPIPDTMIGFAAANPSVVVALTGIVVTLLLFWLTARRNRLEATFKTIELMQEKDARNARFALQDLLAPAETNAEGFAGLSPETRATISSIATQFGFIGSLARRRCIYLGIFFESFASSVVLNHRRLRPFAAWRQTIRGLTDGSLWRDFDWLAVRAERFLLLRAQPLWRRPFGRLGIVASAVDPLVRLDSEAQFGLKAAQVGLGATPSPISPQQVAMDVERPDQNSA